MTCRTCHTSDCSSCQYCFFVAQFAAAVEEDVAAVVVVVAAVRMACSVTCQGQSLGGAGAPWSWSAVLVVQEEVEPVLGSHTLDTSEVLGIALDVECKIDSMRDRNKW